jgi:Trypsin
VRSSFDSTAVEGQMPASGRIARTLLCPLFSMVMLTGLVKCRIETYPSGDSGGPLFDANLRQVGIVSWGDFRTFGRGDPCYTDFCCMLT